MKDEPIAQASYEFTDSQTNQNASNKAIPLKKNKMLRKNAVIKTTKTKKTPFEIGLSTSNRETIREIEDGRAIKASHVIDMEPPADSPFGQQKGCER